MPPYSHHVSDDLLQVFIAFVDVVLWPAKLHDLTLPAGVGEGDLHLVEAVADLLDVAARRADQRSVEALLDQDVT